MCITGGYDIDFEHSSAAQVSQEGARAVRQFPAQHHLFFEGDSRAHVFVVESGWVKLYRTLIDGQRQVVGFCSAGSILGLEGGADHVNACQAVTAVKVRAITATRLQEMCARDPQLANQLLRQMARQLDAAQAQLTTIGAQSSEQKLATFLLSFAGSSSTPQGDFDLPMRRSDIADFLGLRLETVSRKLSDFQRHKWVRMVSMYKCRLLDRDTLLALSEGGSPEDAVHHVAH